MAALRYASKYSRKKVFRVAILLGVGLLISLNVAATGLSSLTSYPSAPAFALVWQEQTLNIQAFGHHESWHLDLGQYLANPVVQETRTWLDLHWEKGKNWVTDQGRNLGIEIRETAIPGSSQNAPEIY